MCGYQKLAPKEIWIKNKELSYPLVVKCESANSNSNFWSRNPNVALLGLNTSLKTVVSAKMEN